MHCIKLEWKEFNVNLEAVEKWLRENCQNYVGNSADYHLKLWFSEEPENRQDIVDYWESIQEGSAEAKSYVSKAQIEEAINKLKADLPSKSWAKMSVAERKIAVGQMPTKEELELL